MLSQNTDVGFIRGERGGDFRWIINFNVFRSDLNKMLMSMSVGPFCDLAQDVDSKDWQQGAVVSLKLDENERECKFLEPPFHVMEIWFSLFSWSVPDVLQWWRRSLDCGRKLHKSFWFQQSEWCNLVASKLCYFDFIPDGCSANDLILVLYRISWLRIGIKSYFV